MGKCIENKSPKNSMVQLILCSPLYLYSASMEQSMKTESPTRNTISPPVDCSRECSAADKRKISEYDPNANTNISILVQINMSPDKIKISTITLIDKKFNHQDFISNTKKFHKQKKTKIPLVNMVQFNLANKLYYCTISG